jgi:hypothetical protein
LKAYAENYTKQGLTAPITPFRCAFVKTARSIAVNHCVGRFFLKSRRSMKSCSRNVERDLKAPKTLIISTTM